MVLCHCSPPGYDSVIYEVFQDCIYTTYDYFAFVIGMSSIVFWICCQAPQFIKNWRRGEAEALSLWFLTEWLLGDSTNLAGCLLTHTLPTQTYTAMLFVGMDVIILTQYVFLRVKNRRAAARQSNALLNPDNHSRHSSDEDGGRSDALSLLDGTEEGGSAGEITPYTAFGSINSGDFQAGNHRAGKSNAAKGSSSSSNTTTDTTATETAPLIRGSGPSGDASYTTPERPLHGGGGGSHRGSLPDSEGLSTATGTTIDDIGSGTSGRGHGHRTTGRLPPSPPRTVAELGWEEEEEPVRLGATASPPPLVHRPAAAKAADSATSSSGSVGDKGPRLFAMMYPLLSLASLCLMLYGSAARSAATAAAAEANDSMLRGRVLSEIPSAGVTPAGEWQWYWAGPGHTGPTSLFTPGYSAMVRPVPDMDGNGWQRHWVPTTGADGIDGPRQLHLNQCKLVHPVSDLSKTLGEILGYISSALYLTSRIPQVVRNFRRRTVEGLSWMMFFCAFMGNLTSLTSIFMRADGKEEWVSEAPFIPGMAGTLAFDLLIVVQYAVYTRRAKKRRATRRLLREKLRKDNDPAQYKLTDTPKPDPFARRGVHDILESPPAPGPWQIGNA